VISIVGGCCRTAISFEQDCVGLCHGTGSDMECSLVVFWTCCGRIKHKPPTPRISAPRDRAIGSDRPMCRLGVFLLSAFAVVASRRLASHHDSSLKRSRLDIGPSKTNGWCCEIRESIMPKQRRSLACQHCKRLKTRCDLPPDAVTCSRCKNLRYVETDSCSHSSYSKVTLRQAGMCDAALDDP
jgi:hypothetical protein